MDFFQDVRGDRIFKTGTNSAEKRRSHGAPDQLQKSADDTKKKIRDAFGSTAPIKATLRDKVAARG